ncbi:phage baseplate assembly protein V [Pantoea sp. BAV 3049]|uniref:phage baseplate assembly protein V n=1 Tax=Pantoea sp. BAV 3049 TaxID=2654188 RepID=UPI0018EF221F|nr:phage baseplate assembly protein V [Pantoea sp. BAV 3049]
MMNFTAIINSRIAAALRAIRLPFRAALSRITTTGGVMTAQLDGLDSETLQEVEVFQHYGLTSVPPEGAMAVVLPLGGRTSHSIVVATEHSQYRIQSLSSGEVSLYNSDGASVTLKQGKIINIEGDTLNVNVKNFNVTATDAAKIDTPELTATQKLTAQGAISGTAGMDITGGEGITAESLTVNGIRVESHRHNTPDGMSDGPQN